MDRLLQYSVTHVFSKKLMEVLKLQLILFTPWWSGCMWC